VENYDDVKYDTHPDVVWSDSQVGADKSLDETARARPAWCRARNVGHNRQVQLSAFCMHKH